jgi:hypothetical protein
MITLSTCEKLRDAVISLATSAAPLGRRLEHAVIAAAMLDENDLSPEHRDRWYEIMERLTKEEAVGDEGKFRATISRMSPEEQEEVARSIFNLFMNVDRAYLRQGRHT